VPDFGERIYGSKEDDTAAVGAIEIRHEGLNIWNLELGICNS